MFTERRLDEGHGVTSKLFSYGLAAELIHCSTR